MQGKWDRHVDKTLCRGNKWGHDNPGDRIGKNEVGDDRVLFYPGRGSLDHDETLPFSAFVNPNNIPIREQPCLRQDGVEILRYSSPKHPSKNHNDTFAHWTTKLLKKLSRVVHKGAGWAFQVAGTQSEQKSGRGFVAARKTRYPGPIV